MATSGLPQEVVARALEDHVRAQREQAELKATLARLVPPSGEQRSVLNELHRVLEP
jgi:hypothetical protein